MDAAQSLHPTDQTLSSYGLGKLDDRAAEAVNEHLMECSDCRKRVAEMSADSFLQRVRDAQKPSSKSTPGKSQVGGTMSDKGTNDSGPPATETLVPELVNHPDYEIKRELGRGGMGVVYLAHNTLMGRDEVLKVMGQHLMDHSGVLERFLREIQAVARLRHPNIVTAHHATRLGKSIVFAMEYVEGLDLSKLVKAKGPMPIAHACLFIHQAALGLQHAHEEGLVHRDIKPHNLMLSRKGDKATVKILDFGLAKAAREEKVNGGLTATGQALGTPDYIAPEQILDAQTADIRADIYSLGGTLYYLLTGRPPFQAKSLYDLYQAHISRNADPLNLVRPDVPAELAALVAKMMAKDPAERFQTPGEVAQALKPFCTKANAALRIVKTDVSQTDPAKAGRSVAEAASAATQVETDADRRIVRPRKSSESSVSESRWESMIDFRETEGSQEAAPDVAPSRRSPWVWASVTVGVLMLGLFAAWLGGVFKVKTPDGVIVLENVPKDSEILFDGNKITFAWPGGGKPVEIRAVPGQHRVEVNKEGFRTFGQDVTIKTDGSEEVTVRLEPLVVKRQEPKKEESLQATFDGTPVSRTDVVSRPTNDGTIPSASGNGGVPPIRPEGSSQAPLGQPSAPSPVPSGWTSLFNGKDLSGWAGPLAAFEVRDGALRCKSGRSGTIYFQKEFSDFVIRVEFRLTPGANDGLAIRYPGTGTSSDTGMCEIQVLDDFAPKHRHIDPRQYNGSVYGMVAAERGHLRPVGEWNTEEVTVKGSHINVELNGYVIIDKDLIQVNVFMGKLSHTGKNRTSGFFGLAGHGEPVDYRKIEIKELNGESGVGDLTIEVTRNTVQPLIAQKPVSVLIITGDDVAAHDWRGTTQVFKQILNDPSRFTIDVTESPARDLTDANLARYDVLLLNYKDTPKGGPDTKWSEVNKAAFLSAVRSGKCLYVHHYSSGAFAKPNWTEFENAIAGGFRSPNSPGFHGPPHVFTVKKTDVKIPISEGMPESFKHVKDELYSNSLLTPGSVVLATAYSDPAKPRGTGKAEAMIWVNQYGMGRVVHNVLGHDPDAMKDPNYQIWVRRCIEWAAVGNTGLTTGKH